MKNLKPHKPNLFGALFGFVFLAAGFAAAYMTFGAMTIQYFASQNWQPVAADISQLELKTNSGDSTTYQVLANYSYSFNGAEYASDDVSLSISSDNIGDYWQILYRKLSNDDQNQTATAWVNPDNPEQALLDRTFRWSTVMFGSMFILMFSGAGAALMYFSLKARKSQGQEIDLARANGINSNEKSGYWFLFWFASVFFLMGSFSSVMIIPDVLEKGEYGGLFVLIFVFVGATLMAFAWRGKERYKTIGPSPVYLNPLPGEIAGHIGGSFNVGYMAWRNKPLMMTLSCLRKTKSGKNTNTTVVWQESTLAYCEQQSQGMLASFVFDCPDDLPATKEWQNRSSIEWELKAEGYLMINSQAFDFSRSWSIPVIKPDVATLSSIDIPLQFIQQQADNKSKIAKESGAAQIQVSRQQGMTEVVNLTGRAITSSLLGMLFGVIFAGVGVFTVNEDWWPGYIFIVLGVFVSLSSLFLIGREIELKIDTQVRMLFMRRSWFGLRLYKREVALYEPSQFSLKKTSSTSSGSTRTEFYEIKVDNNGKKVVVAEGIEGKSAAQAVLDNILKQVFPNRKESQQNI